MKGVIFLGLFLANLYLSKAGDKSKYCDIRGLEKDDWKYGHTSETLINASYIGPIETFVAGKTVMKIISQKSKYLTANLGNDAFTISTNNEFKQYSPETDGKIILISVEFYCVGAKEKYTKLNFRQEVMESDYTGPVLNRQTFEYNFAMPIPEDYDISEFAQIYASDAVSYFSSEKVSSKMQFSLDLNEHFASTYNGKVDNRLGNYYTNLRALKEIKAPFHESYTLNVKDKITGMNTTAEVKINVFASDHQEIADPGEEGEVEPGTELPHPPIFGHHLYFGNYTTHNVLQMDEKITIKYGAAPDTIITQSGYQDYFHVTLDEKDYKYLNVKVIRSLSATILKTEKLIVIDIQGVNKGLDIPGRTALVIRLPSTKEDGQKVEYGANYTCVASYSNSPVIVLSVVMFSVVSINLIVIGWFIHKRMLKSFSY